MNKIFEAINKEISFEFPEKTEFIRCESGLKVSCDSQKVIVHYSRKSDIMRSALILKANGVDGEYSIEEKSCIEDVCLMVDCSRNAVRKVETVKKLIRNLALMGYNSLMLYTEDTYEVDDEPVFGYLRGKYTKAEMKELDEYALALGIELIPCIQTLAHLNQLTRYKYSHFKCFDCSDILMVGNNRTYQLIENMFKTLRECYTTKRIHIGMDEAWLMGRGEYLTVNGYRNPFDIICEHLNIVCEIAKKYNFTPIIWSDMFWRLANKNESGKLQIPEDVLGKVPSNLELCHWEYHSLTPNGFTEKLEVHKQFNNHIWFAGGTAQCNRGFVPHLTYSMKIATSAIKEAKKFGIKSLIETVWGDNGGECAIFSTLPALMQYSYTAKGISKIRLKKEFYSLTGYKFDSFVKIENGHTFCGKYTEDMANPAKWALYNDLFTGYLDVAVRTEDKRYFIKAKQSLLKQRKGQYAYLFETAYTLCDLLSIKYDMGIRIRKAYADKNKTEMFGIVKDIDKLLRILNKFVELYRVQWYKENKPNGLEIQEIRLGGLIERIKGCKKRLLAFIDNDEEIVELNEPLLKQAVARLKDNGRLDVFSHEAIASVNAFDGFTEVDV